jgi:hypothetical protein
MNTTKRNEKAKQIINLIEHILTMADDSYLRGHPEWLTIVNEAQAVKEA